MGGSSAPAPALQEVAAPPPPPQLANTSVIKTAQDIVGAGKMASGKGFAGTILTSPEGTLNDNSSQPLHPKLLGGT